ncbi:MAG: T9SS C-terminal target domain-containing protein [Verrucomicrobia bacterium]|nr:T9SS C-terminal target domain-containing protein [Cytophagales bacterium]
MKLFPTFFIQLLLLSLPVFGQGAELVFAGIYTGRNLTVQNPAVSGGYCTNEVFVNNKRVLGYVAASLYEINLSFLKMNDSVTVVISHKENCTPKVLNPQALRPSINFRFIAVNLDGNVLKWTAQGENTTDIYQVQQLVNGNWLSTQKLLVTGKGIYSTPVRHNVGLNRYRIAYKVTEGKYYYSEEKDFDLPPANLAPVAFYPRNVSDKMFLSREVPYQILEINGKLIKSGKGREIMLSELKTGTYLLAVENRKEKFFKK